MPVWLAQQASHNRCTSSACGFPKRFRMVQVCRCHGSAVLCDNTCQAQRSPTQHLMRNCFAGAAPWAQTYGLKKLPKAAELTLQKVYSEWTHPPNAIVDSLWDLHQIPR